MSWELIGEDCEAMYHPGLLPLDWRTKARALLACAGEVDSLTARTVGQFKQRTDAHPIT